MDPNAILLNIRPSFSHVSFRTDSVFQSPEAFQTPFRLPTKFPTTSTSLLHPISNPPVYTSERAQILKMRRQRRSMRFQPNLTRVGENEALVDTDYCEELQKNYHERLGSTTIYQDDKIRVTSWNKVRCLCTFVCGNDLPMVAKLLNLGVSPNCFDEYCRTPLHLAVSKMNYEMTKLLLNRGANPNLKDRMGNSCLHLAACTHNLKMSKILLDGGANVNARDYRGRSPLDLAQSKLKLLTSFSDSNVSESVRVPNCTLKQVKSLVLLLLLEKRNKQEDSSHIALLTSFQNKLQLTENPEHFKNELDSLNKILNQMEFLSISK